MSSLEAGADASPTTSPRAGAGPASPREAEAADQGLACRQTTRNVLQAMVTPTSRFRRGDDRRHGGQRGLEGAHHRAVHIGVLSVRPGHLAVGVRGRWRSRWRPVGCSGRYWPRRPKVSGCSMRRSRVPSCFAPVSSVPCWRLFGWRSSWRFGLRPDRVGVGRSFGVVWCHALSASASVISAAQQGIERHVLTRLATYVFGILGIGALFSVVGVAAGWFSVGLLDNVGIELGVIMIVASALVLLVSAVLAGLRLSPDSADQAADRWGVGERDLRRILRPCVGLARDIVVERRAIERGHVHPRRGKGLGLEALVWREWQRLWRFRNRCSFSPRRSSFRTPLTRSG